MPSARGSRGFWSGGAGRDAGGTTTWRRLIAVAKPCQAVALDEVWNSPSRWRARIRLGISPHGRTHLHHQPRRLPGKGEIINAVPATQSSKFDSPSRALSQIRCLSIYLVMND